MAQSILEQCALLLKAKEDKDFKLVLAIAKDLAPKLEKAYFSSPELLQDDTIKAANTYIRRLQRAQYIKKPKNPKVYRAGSPGLGKKK
ncbi:MAG TPA: hypothetical protein PLV64_11460 [Anaerolineales bacterium]|nr:hypothetical protein [Anaerolineales bacterium]